ncbi:SET methyltransferase domain containing protein [Nitzschia inconspicua]|uniref:SET methyltransferase domain containing protein n=1 Tax=Nitzschia inconspicua TaxID=303405 RepID=A0A9K3KK01_9STRA|nr:SET methyltransferase domain containing protein [Nitzschia inconspicua]
MMSSGRIELAEDAPEVNLNVCVVENHGLEVVEDTKKGRIVRASINVPSKSQQAATTTSSSKYRLLLRERPAIVCPQQDYMAFMEAFLDAPIEIQLGILDMFYQPLDSPMGQSLLEPTRLLFFLGVLEDVTVIHQLLCILMTNGHQYHGDRVALVIFGSKFSHSCQPNAAFSSLSEDGCLECYSLTNIRNGEEVTVSYMSDMLETPTLERRQWLWQTKSFLCTCPRCLGPDYCRCLPCPSCLAMIPCDYERDIPQPKTRNQKVEDNDNDNWRSFWRCDICQLVADSDRLQKKEREIHKALKTVEQDLLSRKNFDPSSGGKEKYNNNNNNSMGCSPDSVQELVQECIEELSSTHYLTIKSLRLWVMSSTAQAYVTIKQNVLRGMTNHHDLRASSYIRMSVLGGIQLVRACECVAANCTGCYHWSTTMEAGAATAENRKNATVGPKKFVEPSGHPPQYDRATPMRHVAENLLQLPLFLWPPIGMEMVHRYLPTLRIKFRCSLRYQIKNSTQRNDIPETIDMLDLFETLWQTIRCSECGTVWDGSVAAMTAPSL